jgi:hypothetical protein
VCRHRRRPDLLSQVMKLSLAPCILRLWSLFSLFFPLWLGLHVRRPIPIFYICTVKMSLLRSNRRSILPHLARSRRRSPRRVAVACAALRRRRSRRAAPPPHAAVARAAHPPRSRCRACAAAPSPSHRCASTSPAPLPPPRLHLARVATPVPRLRLPRAAMPPPRSRRGSASCTSRSVSVAGLSASFLKRDGRKTQNSWRFEAPVGDVWIIYSVF